MCVHMPSFLEICYAFIIYYYNLAHSQFLSKSSSLRITESYMYLIIVEIFADIAVCSVKTYIVKVLDMVLMLIQNYGYVAFLYYRYASNAF